jgi:hypothetical protein
VVRVLVAAAIGVMDIDVELPDNFEWYKDQIAGHHPSVVRNGYRQIGKRGWAPL